MDRSELKNIIKKLVGNIISGVPESKPKAEDKLPISTKYSRFDLITQFPVMIPVLIDLMTEDFELFIKDIYWVAPKPTTFKIIFINGQHFFLMYDPKSWTAQIEGKKYYLLELRDSELAAEAISRILRYGQIEDKPLPNKDKSSEESSTEEIPVEEPETPEETPEA